MTRAPTISGGTTPKITKWSANCFFRFVNAIVACRDAYIEYYGTANKVTLDAHDVKGPWEAIALLYNSTDPIAEVDESLLPGDCNVTGHIAGAPDFFQLRHPCNAADLEKHHNAMKGKINTGMINKNKSGQGETDVAAEIEKLVEAEAASRGVDAEEDETW